MIETSIAVGLLVGLVLCLVIIAPINFISREDKKKDQVDEK